MNPNLEEPLKIHRDQIRIMLNALDAILTSSRVGLAILPEKDFNHYSLAVKAMSCTLGEVLDQNEIPH